MSIKKKVLAGVMSSTVMLSALAPVTPFVHTVVAHANTTDDKIAAAEATIANAQASAAETQAALNTIQASVDAANARVDQLVAESKATNAQIESLRQTIDQRSESLKTQARSAQTNGTVTSYINTVLNSKSLTDAVQKVMGMSQVVKASNDMMQQQKKDEAALEQKLVENGKAYDEATVLQQQLEVQKHSLDAAKAAYESTIASTQEEKEQLQAKKAEEIAKAQEEAARQAAAQKASDEAAAQRIAQQQQLSTNTNTPSNNTPSNPAPSNNNSSTADTVPVNNNKPSGSVSKPSYSTGRNPYPVGQCTWGVYEILGGRMPIYQGNAGNWVAYANSSSPAPGAIMVFSPAAAGNDLGHVAVVDSVNANGTVNIREANYNGQQYVTSRSNVSTAGCSFIIL
ncbi:MAG: CHAP domain-containing protein [Streptococcaceae bacterium]|jgi:peptidoglycan hydrolase CwlO-like protein|nr:CHAP domain-containing protein [Streptococcaceae bacterium]